MSEAHLDPLLHVDRDNHPDRASNSRAEAGRAIREIGHALVGHDAPIELIDDVTRTLADLTRRLDDGALRSRGEMHHDAPVEDTPADDSAMTSHDERPISGRSSPWGLDIEVRREGDEAVSTVILRAAHEGAPGRSHGGIVAALFDDVYGFVLQIVRQPAFTGELWIRYEAGVPIGEPLSCRVRLERQEGRKMFMTGELTVAATGQVLSRSTAIFIAMNLGEFIASTSH